MTCIVGITTPEGVIIGGDSAGVANYDLQLRADEKVFKRGPFVIGFTSSFRMGQIVRYNLNVPKHPEGMDDMEYMVTRFIDAVRECLENGGWKKKKDDRESGGTFLVGYRKKLYKIESDFQVGESLYDFNACGCGEQIALGSLHSTQNQRLFPPETRLLHALQAAEAFSAGVRAPFVFEEIYE